MEMLNSETYKYFMNIYKNFSTLYVLQMNPITLIFALIIIWKTRITAGFLNKIQLKYTRYILSSPDVANEIKEATKEILVENYQPWLKNQYKSFVRQNAKKMNRIYVRELYQYAIYGLLESLQAYNGSVGLHKYATKFVHGQMYKGMNELAIMKPMSLYYSKQGHKSLKPQLVSYDDYWMFDKIKEGKSQQTPSILEDIREIMRTAPSEYSRLFFLRYDYHTMNVIRSIAAICELESYSDETYRKKMKSVIKYVAERLSSDKYL